MNGQNDTNKNVKNDVMDDNIKDNDNGSMIIPREDFKAIMDNFDKISMAKLTHGNVKNY